MKEFLSTTEASKYCHVSRLTVINWAKKGLIPTHKTPGGHRRISKSDMLSFMKDHGIDHADSDLSSPDINFKWCWDYHKNEKWKNHKCRGCLVYLTHSKKCYALMEKVGPKRIFCKFKCDSCQYHKEYQTYSQSCWEFHQEAGRSGHKCHECIVFLSGIKKCYVLREETEHKKIYCKSSCSDCDYYKKITRRK